MHVLTYPIAHGDKLNVVAFRTSCNDWDAEANTKISTREDALRDFAGFNSTIINTLKLTEEELTTVWFPHVLESLDA